MTLDAAGIQAIAAGGALMLAMITLIGGWTYWLVRDAERNLRTEMSFHREELRLYREQLDRFREDMDRIREDMRRNHREVLTLMEGHTHAADGNAVFRRLPDAADS